MTAQTSHTRPHIASGGPVTTPIALPVEYRLLSVFSCTPLKSTPALEAAGLRLPVTDSTDPQDPGRAPISDAHRALLRRLTTDGRIRWVTWGGPDGPGYVLTGIGEAALEVYHQRYGPAHAPRRGPALAEVLAAQRATPDSQEAV